MTIASNQTHVLPTQPAQLPVSSISQQHNQPQTQPTPLNSSQIPKKTPKTNNKNKNTYIPLPTVTVRCRFKISKICMSLRTFHTSLRYNS